MSAFLYVSGLVIGIASFLYIGSFLRDTTETITKKDFFLKLKAKHKKSRKDIFKNSPINKINPGLRMCPFCRVKLSRDEPLYASKVFDKNDKKLLIHGCKLCYKPEKL
jgi:hypothetical protein